MLEKRHILHLETRSFLFLSFEEFFYPLGFNPLFHKSKTPEPLATTTACDESNFYEIHHDLCLPPVF